MPYYSPFAARDPAQSPYATSSAGGVNIDQILAQRAQNPPDEGGGVLGLLGNAWEGLSGLVGGVGSLISAGFHDTGQAIGDVIPGEQNWGIINDTSGYKLDDIAKGMVGFTDEGFHPLDPSTIAGSIYHRWEPFLPGGTPAQEGWEGLYEDPLGAVLDVASVASLGAGAASKIGQGGIAAGKFGEAAKVARAGMLDDLAKAGLRSRTLQGAATRAGLEAAEGTVPLYAKLLPKATSKLVEGQGLVPTATAYNPLYRAVAQPIKTKLLSEPVANLSKRMDDLEAASRLMPGDDSLETAKLILDKTIKEAEKAKISTIARPTYAKFNAYASSMRELAHTNSLMLNRRNQKIRKATDDLRRRFEANPEIADNWAIRSQLLDRGIIDEAGELIEPKAFAVQHGYGGGGEIRLGQQAGEALPPATAGTVDTLTPPVVRTPDEVAFLQKVDAVKAKGAQLQARVDELAPDMDPEEYARQSDAVRRLTDELDNVSRRYGQNPDFDSRDAVNVADLDEMFDMGLKGGLMPRQVLERKYAALMAKHEDAVFAPPDKGMARNVAVLRRVEAADPDRAAIKNARGFSREDGPIARELLAKLDSGQALTKGEGITLSGLAAKYRAQAKKLPEIEGEDALAPAPNTAGLVTLEGIDDAVKAAGIPQPIYYPMVDATRKAASDFATSKMEKGANIAARDPHMKQLKNILLKRGTWEADPIEAFSRRAARAVREEETLALWTDMVERYGFELPNTNPVVPKGWKAVAPDMLFVNHRLRSAMTDRIDRYIEKGFNPDDATSRALKETMEEHQDEIARLIETGDVKVYAMPEVVLKNLNASARYAPVFGGTNVQLYYDTAMNAWRGLALTASPRWVVNNVLGNIGFTLMQGAKFADAFRIAAEKYRVLVKNWGMRRAGLIPTATYRETSLAGQTARMLDEVNTPVGHGHLGDTMEQYRPHLPANVADRPYAKAIERYRTSKFGQKMGAAGQTVRTINSTIEDAFREASFLTAAERAVGKTRITSASTIFTRAQKRIDDIMEGGFDEAKARVALDEVNRFFGDYGAMTPFERHVIRRWIFPFWGFYRHTTRLMLTFPFEYPGKAHILEGLENVTNDMIEEYGPLPDWMRSPMPMGPPGGMVPILSGAGANPFAGPAQGMEGLGQMFSPAIKTGLEQIFRKNVFTGQPFSDRDTFTPYGSDQAYDINTLQPVDQPAPGILQTLIGQVPQYDMIRDLLAGANTYDTASIADALQQRMGDMGEASPIDPETGQPYYDINLGDQLAKMFGANVFEYDLDAFQERRRQEQLAVLREALERGVA